MFLPSAPTEHPEIIPQHPGVIRYMQAMFYFRWQHRPLDMPYSDIVSLRHPGIALNYLRTQVNASREQMARMLFLATSNYTAIEMRGTPLKQSIMDLLAGFCEVRGMPNLAKYFVTYLQIRASKASRRNKM